MTQPSLGGLSGSNISELKSPTKKQLPGSVVIASSIEDSSNFHSDCGTDTDVGGLQIPTMVTHFLAILTFSTIDSVAQSTQCVCIFHWVTATEFELQLIQSLHAVDSLYVKHELPSKKVKQYTECKYGGPLGRPGSSCAKARLMRRQEFCFDCASQRLSRSIWFALSCTGRKIGFTALLTRVKS